MKLKKLTTAYWHIDTIEKTDENNEVIDYHYITTFGFKDITYNVDLILKVEEFTKIKGKFKFTDDGINEEIIDGEVVKLLRICFINGDNIVVTNTINELEESK